MTHETPLLASVRRLTCGTTHSAAGASSRSLDALTRATLVTLLPSQCVTALAGAHALRPHVRARHERAHQFVRCSPSPLCAQVHQQSACGSLRVPGCLTRNALNYDSVATEDDGSCALPLASMLARICAAGVSSPLAPLAPFGLAGAGTVTLGAPTRRMLPTRRLPTSTMARARSRTLTYCTFCLHSI
jgi:hypothetical protein